MPPYSFDAAPNGQKQKQRHQKDTDDIFRRPDGNARRPSETDSVSVLFFQPLFKPHAGGVIKRFG